MPNAENQLLQKEKGKNGFVPVRQRRQKCRQQGVCRPRYSFLYSSTSVPFTSHSFRCPSLLLTIANVFSSPIHQLKTKWNEKTHVARTRIIMGRDECREIEEKVREGKAPEYRSATQSKQAGRQIDQTTLKVPVKNCNRKQTENKCLALTF